MPLILILLLIPLLINFLLAKYLQELNNFKKTIITIHNLSYIGFTLCSYLIIRDWVKAEEIDFNASTFRIFGNVFVNILFLISSLFFISPILVIFKKSVQKVNKVIDQKNI